MRAGFLHGGWLFIESDDLKAIVAGRFRSYLSQCLAHANKALPAILRDERLAPMLTNMSKAYAGPEYGTSAGKVRARARVRACVRACACACAHARVEACAAVCHRSSSPASLLCAPSRCSWRTA